MIQNEIPLRGNTLTLSDNVLPNCAFPMDSSSCGNTDLIGDAFDHERSLEKKEQFQKKLKKISLDFRFQFKKKKNK